MASYGFRRTLKGRLVLRTDEVERTILTDVVTQLVELVEPEHDPAEDPLARLVGIDPEAERPDDPALARLFPDAYADDDEASSEFRRFTERSLREGKVANARTVLDSIARSGDKITLSEPEAQAWLGTLNDLRLALGSRLGIEEDNHHLFAALPDDHPAAAVYSLYDWLSYLQETLVRSLMGFDVDLVPED
ncbi:MAG: DUF2017 domain-containing protein [Candidatus Nanopelagicales bacterium]